MRWLMGRHVWGDEAPSQPSLLPLPSTPGRLASIEHGHERQ